MQESEQDAAGCGSVHARSLHVESKDSCWNSSADGSGAVREDEESRVRMPLLNPENSGPSYNGLSDGRTRFTSSKQRSRSNKEEDQQTLLKKRAAAMRRKLWLLTSLSMFANVCLFFFKLYISITSRSLAVMASAVDSFLDLVSQTIIYFALKGSRIVDEEKYPVGRNRLEPIGIIVCASLMGIAALQLVWEGASKLLRGTLGGEDPAKLIPNTDEWTVYLLGSAIIIKLILFILCRSAKNESDSMMVLSEDHRNDVLSNGVALFTAHFSHEYTKYWWLDPVGGIVIAVYICTMWIIVASEQAAMLEGVTADAEFLASVRQLADTFHDNMYVDVVRGYHFGKRYLVEVEVVLPGDMVVYDAHDISLDLQKNIEKLERVERAFVHVDYMPRDENEHKATYLETPPSSPAHEEDIASGSSSIDFDEEVEVAGDAFDKAVPHAVFKRHVHFRHHHKRGEERRRSSGNLREQLTKNLSALAEAECSQEKRHLAKDPPTPW